MAQKLFSTGPGTYRRAERKETIDGLGRTSGDSYWSLGRMSTCNNQHEKKEW